MTVISKIAGGLSLLSALNDIHKTSLIYSRRSSQKACADTYISKSIGGQKTANFSYKDSKRKSWITKQNYAVGTNEFLAGIKGYLYGAKTCAIRYMPNFVLSAIAMIPKNKYKLLPNAAAVGLGVLEAIDFVSNSTNINERTDYLE